MRNLNKTEKQPVSKTADVVANFFGKCMADPEIDFDEFVESVSTGLGSVIGLHEKGINVPLALDKAKEAMWATASISKQIKPIADIMRTGVMSGVIVISLNRQK